MKRLLLSTLTLALLAPVCQAADTASGSTVVKTAALGSGIKPENMDKATRAQDDFYRYAQGGWLKANEIPSDKSDWGTFMQAREDVQQQLRSIVEGAAKDGNKVAGTDNQKIGDLYNSFMDEKKLNALGIQSLKTELSSIAALSDKKAIPALIAHFHQIGVTTPLRVGIHQDNKNSSQYVVGVSQSGLGLPNRDYYLKLDDPKMTDIRNKYQAHIEKMLTLAGEQNAAEQAKRVVALETEIAKVQWTAVQNRDPVKSYNKFAIGDLPALTPAYDWQAYLQATGMAGKINELIIQQPSYIKGFNESLSTNSLDAWKSYFTWHLINVYAPFLSSDFVNADFAFKGALIAGIQENRTRDKRGVALVDQVLGEAVGKAYVEKYFSPEVKQRTEKMVRYFLAAFKQSIDTLDWMSPETKKQAQIKLSKISVKIGYQNKWLDYSKLTIRSDDLVGNLIRARAFAQEREVAKLGKPIDREEWHMTPQTVNAYYSPEMNEIVFPAARLQSPLFDVNAEDAFNYGALGISIGHEISHAFDDQGAQYDGDGNLRNWWTAEDKEKFKSKTKVLVEQYNGYSPVPGHFLNGELTLGENIADNAGIVMALRAYKLSLEGKPAPVIDGWTAEQRLFMGLAQARRNKSSEKRAITLVKTDVHSPGEFRVNGSMVNHPDFYKSFDVKPGDKMYLAPEKRVAIW
ncbi:M13 family metallopeptidase [Undibacterium sp. CY18W]|uniref:M13 family metallopeptidase n=1 Tax=Undibacterium hunanense TaxID=2762292 RepID=A0ABR6ZQV6_9BURK|nr:M13 family metallopeptidase [Undibacterium hunanense]MBC3918204.1 M13 family metallopeptidase [Undibacterium hunanense]